MMCRDHFSRLHLRLIHVCIPAFLKIAVCTCKLCFHENSQLMVGLLTNFVLHMALDVVVQYVNDKEKLFYGIYVSTDLLSSGSF